MSSQLAGAESQSPPLSPHLHPRLLRGARVTPFLHEGPAVESAEGGSLG